MLPNLSVLWVTFFVLALTVIVDRLGEEILGRKAS
jgi:hypothetical protein